MDFTSNSKRKCGKIVLMVHADRYKTTHKSTTTANHWILHGENSTLEDIVWFRHQGIGKQYSTTQTRTPNMRKRTIHLETNARTKTVDTCQVCRISQNIWAQLGDIYTKNRWDTNDSELNFVLHKFDPRLGEIWSKIACRRWLMELELYKYTDLSNRWYFKIKIIPYRIGLSSTH